MSHRKERFTSTLKQCLAEILMIEMGNPLFRSVSIIDVLVSPDLKKARVFVSLNLISDTDERETLATKLIKAKGFIKHLLNQKMYLKYIPELEFVIDRPLANEKEDGGILDKQL